MVGQLGGSARRRRRGGGAAACPGTSAACTDEPPFKPPHLQLLVGDVLAQLLGHALEVLEGDLARLVVVKQAAGRRGGGGAPTVLSTARQSLVTAIVHITWNA